MIDTSLPIRIKECNVLHFTIGWSFFELDTKSLKSFTNFLEIVYSNGNVSKSSTWIGVITAVISLEVRVRFGSVVVCEFKHTFVAQENDRGFKLVGNAKQNKKKTSQENVEASFSSGVNSLPL